VTTMSLSAINCL